jgi:predicted  nucleic acid-binding Zn-ribbon protein
MGLVDSTQNIIQCDLTRKQIENDIEAYQNRLNRAEAKLNDLPHSLMGRKLRDARRVLLSEIRHVKTLIDYAQEALAEIGD